MYYYDYYYNDANDILTSISSLVSNYSLGAILIMAFKIYTAYVVLEKTGEKGWKTLIPIYRDYIEYKQYWVSSLFWLDFFSVVIALLFFMFGMLTRLYIVFTVLAVIVLICKLIIKIMLQIKKSACFNENALFGFALLFLNTIFVGILALDKKYSYIGNPFNNVEPEVKKEEEKTEEKVEENETKTEE